MQFFGQLSFGKFAIWMRFRCLHRSVSGIACRDPRRISLVRLNGEQIIIWRYSSFNGTALTACTHFIFQCRIVDSEQVGRRDSIRTWKLFSGYFHFNLRKLLECIPVRLCFAVLRPLFDCSVFRCHCSLDSMRCLRPRRDGAYIFENNVWLSSQSCSYSPFQQTFRSPR